VIELRDVSVTYPNGVTALEPTSLTIQPGQVTILIGTSGAGKSTLLRCLNLLVRPTHGAVWADGVGELTSRNLIREHRRRTGMIFQHHQLIGRHTALQNTLTGRLGYHSAWRTLWPLSRAEQRLCMECLDRVGLLPRALERVENLSGGERQRVGIARALAQQPRLILADEPVASLDPATAERILDLLHRICREDQITTVISLHQVNLACMYADRVIGLKQGRIIFDGQPEQLTPNVLAGIYGTEPSVNSDVVVDSPPTAIPCVDAIR
jgi:phosphonate transport system ATP-binding protein